MTKRGETKGLTAMTYKNKEKQTKNPGHLRISLDRTSQDWSSLLLRDTHSKPILKGKVCHMQLYCLLFFLPCGMVLMNRRPQHYTKNAALQRLFLAMQLAWDSGGNLVDTKNKSPNSCPISSLQTMLQLSEQALQAPHIKMQKRHPHMTSTILSKVQ